MNKQWKAVTQPFMKRSETEERHGPNEYPSREEIGRQLGGLSQSTVELIERAALAKIRSSPELRQAFDEYKEAGLPRIKELFGDLLSSAQEQRLLDYQQRVAELWAVYERLRAADDAGVYAKLPLWRQAACRRALPGELREILAAIAEFQKRLAGVLNRRN